MSYCDKVKELILANIPKKKCCARIMADIAKLSQISVGCRDEIIRGEAAHFKCGSCFSHFAAALFLGFGSVTDPDKQYHLELAFGNVRERDAVLDVMTENGVEMKKSVRGQRYILYIKDSSKIGDFLALIGANKAAFDLINAKIVREVREDANRQMNCDMANISKTLTSARQYSEAIEKLYADGTIVRLPPELRETARLRYENSQASMSELGLLHDPPITKSGVKHRLDKILAYIKDESK